MTDAGRLADSEHVLTAREYFDVHDTPDDLSIYRCEDWKAFGFCWVLALVIFHQIFTRYALNDSASWTEEIARYLLICTVFIGAAIGVRKNNHIQVDFLYRIFPRPLMRQVSTVVDSLRIAFFAYACIGPRR
jgi:TRAP-type C4-dicarboxylate transport system permease small subunit